MSSMKLEELEVGGANAPISQVDRAASSGIPESSAGEVFRLQHQLDEGMSLDALVVNKGSDTLVVSFHGATNQEITTLPRFERLRTLLDIDVSSMFFSDPTLLLDPKIWLTWYTGNGEEPLHHVLARWVQRAAEAIGARRIVLTGSSGGGFAALQVGAHVPGCSVLAMNAQTDLGNYLVNGESYSQQKDYVRVVRPEIWKTFSRPQDIEGSGWTDRCDDRVSALRAYSTPRECQVYIFQNIEEFHYADHFLPFLDAAWKGGNHDNIVPWVNRQGFAHVVPTLPVFKELVNRVIVTERKLGR